MIWRTPVFLIYTPINFNFKKEMRDQKPADKVKEASCSRLDNVAKEMFVKM